MFFLDSRPESTEKGEKWTKKVENAWKKVVWPAFGCAQHLKAGRNTQHTPYYFKGKNGKGIKTNCMRLLNKTKKENETKTTGKSFTHINKHSSLFFTAKNNATLYA